MIRRLLPLAATLLARTLRIRFVGEAIPERAIVMFWHGKMFAGWYAMRRRRPIALVSRSKDGQFLSSVLSFWHYKLARGSTGKRGMEALEEAIAALKAGDANTLAITPDGPRGPQHVIKRGALIAARETGLPLYMLTIRLGSCVVLRKSWDDFEVPLPFSVVTIRAEKVNVPDSLDDDTLATLSGRWQQ